MLERWTTNWAVARLAHEHEQSIRPIAECLAYSSPEVADYVVSELGFNDESFKTLVHRCKESSWFERKRNMSNLIGYIKEHNTMDDTELGMLNLEAMSRQLSIWDNRIESIESKRKRD